MENNWQQSPSERQKARARDLRLQRIFNITSAEYDKILKHQKGKCAICRKPPKEGGLRLSVDHDHKSGLVRGLVCMRCNKSIAWCRDDVLIAYAIYQYLNVPPAIRALGEARFGRKGRVTNKVRRRRKKK